MTCSDCKGKGKISLFTSVAICEPCDGTGQLSKVVAKVDVSSSIFGEPVTEEMLFGLDDLDWLDLWTP